MTMAIATLCAELRSIFIEVPLQCHRVRAILLVVDCTFGTYQDI
jgi:hypothetical protein